jgi:hypothetical protein
MKTFPVETRLQTIIFQRDILVHAPLSWNRVSHARNVAALVLGDYVPAGDQTLCYLKVVPSGWQRASANSSDTLSGAEPNVAWPSSNILG